MVVLLALLALSFPGILVEYVPPADPDPCVTRYLIRPQEHAVTLFLSCGGTYRVTTGESVTEHALEPNAQLRLEVSAEGVTVERVTRQGVRGVGAFRWVEP